MATTWVLDLDGVMWLGATPISGSIEAVKRLRSAGHRVAFCTNNASQRVGFYHEKLTRLGIMEPEVLTSAQAAGSLIRPGERVLATAGAGVLEALDVARAVVVDQDEHLSAETVVVGFHTTFDYAAMHAAVRAVLNGARLIASNDDPIYPSSNGPAPGCGSILASIERGAGVSAGIAGKPHAPMAALITEAFGESGIFVGDSLATDGMMARRLGWPLGLVLSGNIGPDQIPDDQDPAWVAGDLAALVDRYLGI